MRLTGDSGVVLNAEFLDRSGGCVPRRRGYQDGRAADDGGGQDPAGEADRPALSPDVSASCVPRIPGSCSATLLPGDIGCLGQFRSRRTSPAGLVRRQCSAGPSRFPAFAKMR